jgi:hypothetical protein
MRGAGCEIRIPGNRTRDCRFGIEGFVISDSGFEIRD